MAAWVAALADTNHAAPSDPRGKPGFNGVSPTDIHETPLTLDLPIYIEGHATFRIPSMNLRVKTPAYKILRRIDAPTARVWETLTMPAYLAQWLGEVVSGEVSAGSSFSVDHGNGYLCDSSVVEVEPFRALSYSWAFPDEPRTDLSWSLRADDARTTLELIHSGLAGLVASYPDGGLVHLIFLEASALGTPLPWTLFWPIHSTIPYLDAQG